MAPQVPTPNDLTVANSPPPSLQPYLARVFGEIGVNGGTIRAAPPNGTGLVNLPVCFWIEGLAVPDRRTITLDLPGAPTAAGQRITYHIDLTVTLASADWDFGDGSSDRVVPPLQCQPPSHGALSLVAHNYTRYSDGQPQGKFQVSVQERYEARVNMRWSDEVGAHTQAVSLGNQGAQTLRAGPYPIKIEQEEGVPIAPGR
jgi:hypothetical protein